MSRNLEAMWTSVWLIVTFIVTQLFGYISTKNTPDGLLDSEGLATKYGHPPAKYDVVTEDGYILTVYRLKGKRKIPILLTHGLADSTDTFLIRGNQSLAIVLANKGYDVWLANSRGNRYSRRHKSLNPDKDAAYWNFTFHQMGIYDLPACIDLVLNETGAKKITAIGHSQGTTIYYVLGSERKEYNSKVNVMISLAPMAFTQNVPALPGLIIQLAPVITDLVKELDLRELFGDNTTLGRITHTLCSIPVIGYTICGNGLIPLLAGSDPTELEAGFFQTLAPHYPGGTSFLSFLHFLQVGYRKQFAQYDYGNEINQNIYSSSVPPLYQLDKVTMPIALFTASNDYFSTVADVAILQSQLPNVVFYQLIPRALCNHLDYVWGLTASLYFYPYLDIVLKLYNPL